MEVFCCCSCKSNRDFDYMVFADIFDGDKKAVALQNGELNIKPSGNDQTWMISSVFDYESETATIDFNVPGKKNLPPVNFTATYWNLQTATHKKAIFEFTDPAGTMAKEGDYPLDHWVQHPVTEHRSDVGCPPSGTLVMADLHDGDKKVVSVHEGSPRTMTIKPFGNKQNWIVTARLDSEACSAMVNFNVPGKPNPPPVPLLASWGRLTRNASGPEFEVVLEFTDPTGTLAPIGYPLNQWQSVHHKEDLVVV
eukprot:TRINITY_DN27158_c0_g1_i2.p1 TRINITY_DN27158_c0_g1~~TRINITY_DN27158_c0_g1_i2.p1  ORF type:complete len:252 (-),score=43.95 TRINITY_DN27158_c0_g1_i2:141-896(-)